MTAKLRGTGRDLSIRNLTGNMGAIKISGSGTYVDKSPRPAEASLENPRQYP